jgi:hypothetical protein
MKNDALEEMLAILTAGGRVTNQPSSALPQRSYGDPANTVEFPAERERRRKAKEARKLGRVTYRGKGK